MLARLLACAIAALVAARAPNAAAAPAQGPGAQRTHVRPQAGTPRLRLVILSSGDVQGKVTPCG